uniref:Biotin carboxyl carrier protein of acetyl-CoA carboxylase n=1 Tax=Gossypium raimondii TaxID=29730 RepID=A0A0D2UBN4_GOSRA|nr:hypothetical protein B456_010G135200 [Gossypium raimondii]
MASSLSTTPSAAFASVAKTTTALPNSTNLQLSTVSFRFSSRLNLRFFSKSLQHGQNSKTVVKAQLNELKQLDCELVIRKKEALPQPPSAAPVVMMQSPSQPPVMPPVPSVPALPPGQASAAPTPAPSLAASKSAKSSLPPFKCPMAGTFYRSPAPGEPPFVKVGDKVQKGQVLCIIEAMKLMNEIEADQSGTIVEILAEDGKAVSVDMPLFVIEP